MDGFPAVFLPRVLPRAGDGAEVFCDVDEEGDQAETKQQGHAEFEVLRFEMDEGFPEGEGTGDDDRPADVWDVVVGEEVCVGEDGDGCGDPEWRKAGEVEMEAAPCACHVGTDGGIHEAGEERDGTDAEKRVFRVAPRSDGLGGFEKLHAGGHEVEQENDADLAP